MEGTPSSEVARRMRMAISPRLATSSFLNSCGLMGREGRLRGGVVAAAAAETFEGEEEAAVALAGATAFEEAERVTSDAGGAVATAALNADSAWRVVRPRLAIRPERSRRPAISSMAAACGSGGRVIVGYGVGTAARVRR